MKLIRLTTTDQTAFFDNTFNEDIIIEPYSKIALQSLTTQVNTQKFIIDAQNSGITYQPSATNTINFNLEDNTYDKSNIDDFFDDFTYKFNSTMPEGVTTTGKQWQVGTVNNIINVDVRAGLYVAPEKPEFANLTGLVNVQQATVGGKQVWSRNGGNVDNDSYMYFKSPCCKGVSSFRCRLNTSPDPLNSGFIIGYMPASVVSNSIIDITQMVYGIRFIDTTQPYKKIISGTEYVVANALPFIDVSGSTNNDYIDFQTLNGRITATKYYTETAIDKTKVLLDEPYDHTTNLFPVIIFTSTGTKLDTIRFTTDPFYGIQSTYIPSENDDELSSIPQVLPTNASVYSLQIDDALLSNSLGFVSQRNPPVGTLPLVNGVLTIRAQKYFSLKDISDAYIVELMNLKIDSFDSIKQQRMNLLHVIPQFDVIKERIVYTASFPIFLSLNNSYPINLREIKARILKEDLSEVETIGYSQMTILIDKEK